MELYGHSHPDADVQVVATNDIGDHLVTLVEFDYRRGVGDSESRGLWSPNH
jgi:hypothetical protein